jgi:hypothetical protein
VGAATLAEVTVRENAVVDIVVEVAGVDVATLEDAGHESAMESWAHEGTRDEDVYSIEPIVEEGVDAKDNLVKTDICKVPHQSYKSGDTSGKKAHGGVASIEHG